MVENSTTPHGEELVGIQHATDGRAGDTKAIGDVQGDTSGKHAAESSSTGIQPVRGILCGTSIEEGDWVSRCRLTSSWMFHMMLSEVFAMFCFENIPSGFNLGPLCRFFYVKT